MELRRIVNERDVSTKDQFNTIIDVVNSVHHAMELLQMRLISFEEQLDTIRSTLHGLNSTRTTSGEVKTGSDGGKAGFFGFAKPGGK